ncbi:MAG: hypothetical protein AAGD10_00030 [Myxococcota bacterium]
MRSTRTWTWALGASLMAHGLVLVLPSPGQATQNVAPHELKLRLRPPPEPDAPPPEPASEPPPPEPEPPPPPPRPRPKPPVRVAEPPPPVSAETAPEAPVPPRPPKKVDLDLKPRWSDPSSTVRRVRARGKVRAEAPSPGLEPSGGGRYIFRHSGFDARVERDGSVRFRDKAAFKFRGLISDFDLTEVAMKIAKDDPFRSDKLAFLEGSRAFRTELRRKADKERMKQAERDALFRLRAIWRGPGTSAERRRLIFEVWDGCAETGSEARVASGRFVRRTVQSFIERTLPRGHPEGFTSVELAAFNADRRSQARFAPYGGASLARESEPGGESETLP